MKLELKHFVGYPHTLGLSLDEDYFHTLEGLDFDHYSVISERINYSLDRVKPFLRPLSDIMNEITHLGETFVPLDKLKERWYYIKWEERYDTLCFYFDVDIQDEEDYVGNIGVWFTNHDWDGPLNDMLPKWVWEQLQEWHFDVHDLLPNDLAQILNNN